MSHQSRPLDAFAVSLMLLLCFSWGFNQVSVKAALPEIPPFTQGAIRSFGAALVVAAWMKYRRVSFSLADCTLRPGLAAGALFGAEFLLIYPGLLWTTASRAVLFLYLAPFFVVVAARWLFPADRFRPIQWVGLALSFAGMLLAFGVPTPAADPRQLLGDLLMVGAAALWAATTLVVKASTLSRAPFEKTMLYQLVVSGPMLAAGALAWHERVPAWPSAWALGWLGYQTFWVVSVTFVIWFALVVRYSASRLSAFTFLTPLCGVAAGHFVLGEPLTPVFAAAVAMVAGGLLLVNRPA